jgi:hypothetical protein
MTCCNQTRMTVLAKSLKAFVRDYQEKASKSCCTDPDG